MVLATKCKPQLPSVLGRLFLMWRSHITARHVVSTVRDVILASPTLSVIDTFNCFFSGSPSHPANTALLASCFSDDLYAGIHLFHPDLSPTRHTYLGMQLLNARDVLFAEICLYFIQRVPSVTQAVTAWSGMLNARVFNSSASGRGVTIQATTGCCCFVYYTALKSERVISSSVWVRQGQHTKPTLSPPSCLTIVPARVLGKECWLHRLLMLMCVQPTCSEEEKRTAVTVKDVQTHLWWHLPLRTSTRGSQWSEELPLCRTFVT